LNFASLGHPFSPPFESGDSMKVSILGAGAVGSMLGGLLQSDSPDLRVLLIGRGEHGRKMCERQSVIIDGPWGSRVVPIQATSDVTEIADSSIVLLTVKSQDTELAARSAQPYWTNAVVVSIQNGINRSTLARYVKPEQLIMAVTASNMNLVEPGRVSLQLCGATVLGPAQDDDRKAVEIAADLFARIGSAPLPFVANANSLGAQYQKLAINALGYASCLSASNFISEAICFADWRSAVGLPLLRECRQLLNIANVRLQRIPGTPSLSQLELLMNSMNIPVVGSAVAVAARRLFDRKPIVFSLLQDLRRCKPTEVDYINGEFVRLANSLRQCAPINATVVDMVHELERRNDRSCFSRDEVIRRFQSLQRPLVVA
jgi:2-dehydropantoate 2-reductase